MNVLDPSPGTNREHPARSARFEYDGPPSLRRDHTPGTNRLEPIAPGTNRPTNRTPTPTASIRQTPPPTYRRRMIPSHGCHGFAAPRIAPCLLASASKQAAFRGRSLRPSHSGTGSRRELLSRQETCPRDIPLRGTRIPRAGRFAASQGSESLGIHAGATNRRGTNRYPSECRVTRRIPQRNQLLGNRLRLNRLPQNYSP